jgi:hypothetical protein
MHLPATFLQIWQSFPSLLLYPTLATNWKHCYKSPIVHLYSHPAKAFHPLYLCADVSKLRNKMKWMTRERHTGTTHFCSLQLHWGLDRIPDRKVRILSPSATRGFREILKHHPWSQNFHVPRNLLGCRKRRIALHEAEYRRKRRDIFRSIRDQKCGRLQSSQSCEVLSVR